MRVIIVIMMVLLLYVKHSSKHFIKKTDRNGGIVYKSPDQYYSIQNYRFIVKMKVTQSCPTSRPHGLQPTRSSIHGIFQARVLEWGAIAFSTYYSYLLCII